MNILHPKNSLLSLNVRLFIISMILLLFLSGASLFFIHYYHLEKAKQQHFQKQRLLLEERIDKKVKILHAATLVLANNSTIQEALVYEDRKTIIDEMGDLRAQFGYWTGFVNYAFHVITFDGRSLYRNYDPDNYGQNVTQHPLMKRALADTTKAFTQMGKGGYGNVYRIINSQPVFAPDNPEELAGFMTVSQGLKQIVMEFAQDGFDYYVFERDISPASAAGTRFVVDSAPYFANRPFSDWVFEESELDHERLTLRNGWYFQTQPIYDAQQRVAAFHLILASEEVIDSQAWVQTYQVMFVLFAAFLLVFIFGLLQLGLLRNNVLKPMRRLTSTLKTIIKTERYDQTVTVLRQDEIGRVTELFNQMLARTDQLIFDLNYQKMAIDQTLIISRADKYGTITDVNENFCTISGYSREELIGKPHNIVRHPETDAAIFKEMWAKIQNKQVWQGEIRNRRKDGTSYYVMSYIIPILNRHNEIQEYLSIREDITLIVELREGLQMALVQAEKDKQMAEQANKAKSDFLASMSHELRTPLNAIIGYTQLLELAQLNPKSLEQVRTILASSKHLLALINDILDFAKLESGKVQFNIEAIEVKGLITEVVQLTQGQAKQFGITLEVEPMAADVSIYVDRLRFKQVMLNLLSNAIKYNRPNGSVILSCEKTEHDRQLFWNVSVRDSGYGIKKQDLTKLFEPFNRLGHESSAIQGTGIGLSITKDLVEQMGGWIDVQSTEGKGSTFSVYFPIKAAVSESLQQPIETGSACLHKSKVLYIGHNPKMMQALIACEKELGGIEVRVAPTAQNGKEQFDKIQPALVLIDKLLDGGDKLSDQIQGESVYLFDSSEIEKACDFIQTHVKIEYEGDK